MTDQPNPTDRPSPQLRAEALEALLTERGLVNAETLDGFINRYVNDVGPMNYVHVIRGQCLDCHQPGIKTLLTVPDSFVSHARYWPKWV